MRCSRMELTSEAAIDERGGHVKKKIQGEVCKNVEGGDKNENSREASTVRRVSDLLMQVVRCACARVVMTYQAWR